MTGGQRDQAPDSAFRRRGNVSYLGVLQNMPRVLCLVWTRHRFFTGLLGTSTLIQSILPAASAWLSKLLVDAVLHVIGSSQKTDGLKYVVFLIGLQIVLGVAGNGLSILSRWLEERLGDLLSNHISMLILEHAIELDLAFFENPVFYDKLQRAQAEAGYRPLTILSSSFRLIQSLISVVSLIVLLVRLTWLAVPVLVIVSVPAFILQSRYGLSRYHMLRSRAPARRILTYLSSLITSDVSIKEIKLLELGRYLIARYRDVFDRFYHENESLSRKQSLANLLLDGFALLGYWGLYIYVAYRTIFGWLTLGDLTLFAQVFSQVQSRFGMILSSMSTMYENSLFVTNLYEFLALEPQVVSCPHARPAPLALELGIELKNVSFQYPSSDRLVLDNVSLILRPNESIALVGENGAGKTTLVKLLTRLYDPDEGQILLDGVDIREYDLCEYRRQIGVIFQDYVRYCLTARENIGFGQIGKIEDLDKIIQAAAKSGCHDLIGNLPEGYETTLGRLFQGGHQLSGGEWQKIALARAFMRDAQILILDEPTAALDPRAEYEIYEQFKELTRSKATILVSHRFSTARMADRVIVLEQGKIIEQGTHTELMTQNGAYATLFRMQAENYQLETQPSLVVPIRAGSVDVSC